MFLSDDRNTAVFPEESGNYSIHLLTDKAHYEVNGDISGPTSVCQPQQPPSAPALGLPQCSFSYASTSRGAPAGSQPSWPNTPPLLRRAQTKTFARSVQPVEAQGSSLMPIQTVYLRLSDQEANVSSISEKVQEQLDSQQPIIIIDSKGHEIQDGPGTQGPMKKPMFATCCKSLLACQACLLHWYSSSTHCPKCRAETGERDIILATGLEEALKAIANIIAV